MTVSKPKNINDALKIIEDLQNREITIDSEGCSIKNQMIDYFETVDSSKTYYWEYAFDMWDYDNDRFCRYKTFSNIRRKSRDG